ncbi:uncharacterized protein LOC117499252 isoform X2 [Trematomus bernacchii]|nr:uncharacterized protein LOC117499252 isoform X2 [Trematomus bernacchii]XP_034007530.1 uncharacterized protein LOC117499252 isoform X2 [Trematomus bernacchii]
MFLMPEPSAPTPTETNITVPVAPEISPEHCQPTLHPQTQSQPLPRPSSVPSCPPPQLPVYDQDVSQWNCSPQQRTWMKTELESMGLLPGSVPVPNPLKMVSLWRGPPQPELIDSVYDFPCAKYFQLHPFFIWKPENDNLMGRLRNNYTLPCIDGCAQPQIASAGVGRPRVIVGITGQYYLLSSRLCCKVCRKRWYADNPSWLEKLPKRFTNLLPAVLTYKKAICKSVLYVLQRTRKSPTDMAKQITELMHLKYERADLAYLLSCKNIMNGEEGKYDQRTISQSLRQETKPAPFGEYGDTDGWNGISVSAQYLTDCLLHEYQHQQFQFPANPPDDSDVKQDVTAGTTPEPHTEPETTCLQSLPLLSSPTGRVFVLDHKRWTGPMKQAVDNLLNKHRGQKDMLKLVDKDYAALVLNSCTDLNSMLHPTTKHHICQYVKHVSKLLNTSSSINISPEKLQERQVLWYSLTEGSETTSVPVVTMPVAIFNPTPPVQTPATPPVQTPATPPVQTPATPLTLENLENIVRNIMVNQQQQQQQQQLQQQQQQLQLQLEQQQQKKKQTKSCLSCGQPKARFENDGSSIHHFYMQGPVRYFYCSTKVFKTYGAEGLTDPKMPFVDFSQTAFFPRELEAMKQRVEAKVQQKRKNTEPEHKGRKCGFCRVELKQGPNSPHIHTGFPGVAGKYVYCPAKVLSLYRDQGMEKKMTWKKFKESAFYETEKKRWEAGKGK